MDKLKKSFLFITAPSCHLDADSCCQIDLEVSKESCCSKAFSCSETFSKDGNCCNNELAVLSIDYNFICSQLNGLSDQEIDTWHFEPDFTFCLSHLDLQKSYWPQFYEPPPSKRNLYQLYESILL